MNRSRFEKKITSLILDEAKIEEKTGFDPKIFALRWLQLSALSIGILFAGFMHFHALFNGGSLVFSIVFLVILSILSIRICIHLRLMNKTLDALKYKWLSSFLPFFATAVSFLSAILLLVFECVWPENEMLRFFKIGYFIVLFVLIHFYFITIADCYVCRVTAKLNVKYNRGEIFLEMILRFFFFWF